MLTVLVDFEETELEDLTRRAKSCDSLNLAASSRRSVFVSSEELDRTST